MKLWIDDVRLLYKIWHEIIFENTHRFPNSDKDSVELHAMSHEETEILGQFCDAVAIYGEQLEEILILGLMEKNRRNNYEALD